MQFLKAFT